MDNIKCPAFPDKIRFGKHNRDRVRTRVQQLQRKLRQNFRIYKCEACGGYHITSMSMKDFAEIKSKELSHAT